MNRFTLTDLLDKKKMLQWLNQGGDPPMALVRTAASGRRFSSFGAGARKEPKPVTDTQTLDVWWSDYRAELSAAFMKSAHNLHKQQTHTQFLAECLSSLGIKGGTVKNRIERAKIARPDLYANDAASAAA